MPSLSCGTLCSTVRTFAHLCVFVCYRHFVPLEVLALASQDCYIVLISNGIRVFGSGGLAGGSYPISFRTRQSSLLAAMVLIVTDGESS